MSEPGPRTRLQHGRALRLVPGGSSSPARDVSGVGLDVPVIAMAGRGPWLTDLDGRSYIDYLQAFGPGILGHGHAGVSAAVAAAMADGPIWGVAGLAEARLAAALGVAIPGMQRVRFTASGTEAVMAAVRLARAATGRRLLVKFDAGYHGHADLVLGDTGSAAAHAGPGGDRGGPAGVPFGALADTVTLPWNDAAAVAALLATCGREVAALLIEPIAGNIGVVLPDAAFVQAVSAARGQGALVIADEVVSAFRFAYGASQAAVGLTADLTVVGKIVGGGLPVGAYGGADALMRQVSPEGPVFQAGTFAGHPAVCAAGLATLGTLARPGVYERLDALGQRLEGGLRRAAVAVGMPVTVSRVAGSLTLWPGRDDTVLGPVRSRADVEQTDPGTFAAMYRALLDRGILLAPSRFEAWFLTVAHDEALVDDTAARAADAFAAMAMA